MRALFILSCSLVAAAPSALGEDAPAPRTHTIVGQLVRLDLARGAVTLKVTEPLREYVLFVDPETTRVVSLGRRLRLEDLPTGVPADAICDDGIDARHRARLLRVGGSPRSSSPAREHQGE